jgi:propanol-preferring alcohol dehydrogenase
MVAWRGGTPETKGAFRRAAFFHGTDRLPIVTDRRPTYRLAIHRTAAHDAATVAGTYPGLKLPRVPGHDVVGRIEALGSGVCRWKIGQRVGVGFLGGEDRVCEPCRRRDIVNCQNLVIPGVTVDGEYAEVMIAEARGIASIPDERGSAEAAPPLCAGITTYNALRHAGLRAGDLVALQGIGGLGHLGIQFARHMGFHTVAKLRAENRPPRCSCLATLPQ